MISKFVRILLINLVVTLLVINFASCSYSFTGASVPPHLQSIAIPIFEDRSGYGEPGLREDFTNELIQKFIDDNTLQVDDKTNSDAILECTILSLKDDPAAISGGEDVTSRRMTITVKVTYKDLVKRKTVLDKNFSDYGDYENTGDITTARRQAITEAIDKITEDILLGVVSNW